MALLHWYKLDGNTNDSIGNNNLSANTATYTSTGKIGGAYTFAANNTINNTSGLTLYYDATISAWGYNTNFTTNQMLFSLNSDAWNGADLYFTNSTVCWNNGDGDGNLFKNNSVNVTQPSLNTWHHYTVVISSSLNKIILYLDGAYHGEALYKSPYQINKGFTIGNYYPGNTGYAWIGKIDDVRIYNHALSPKEVKELSQAKVLHYNFDDFQEPTTNLYTSQVNSTNDWLNSGTAPTINNNDTSIGKPLNIPAEVNVRSCTLTATASYHFGYEVVTISASTQYTLSIWYYQTAINAGSRYYARNVDTNMGDMVWEGNGSSSSSTWPLNKWIRLYVTFTTAVGQTSVFVSGYPNFSSYPNKVFITAPQLEAKDHATPFVNGSRTGVVHDVSGYGNDGSLALATTPQWYEDGIGRGCYRFNGTTQRITTSLTATQLTSLTTCSISFWRKSTALASWLPFVGQTNLHYLMATSGGTGAFYHENAAGTKTIYVDGIVSATPSTELANWHHYVITHVNLSLWTTFNIGGYAGEWLLEGDYDDVRIYNTVLTQADVNELYQTRANLDNVGNLFTKCIVQGINYQIDNLYYDETNTIDSMFYLNDIY